MLPKTQLAFLTTQYGRPFTMSPFTHWFKECVRAAGLPEEASFHGLRKSAARRLAEAGCSVKVIAAITGHRSLGELAKYTASADQLRLARMGIETVS
jgi:site-specific recombinase XerD